VGEGQYQNNLQKIVTAFKTYAPNAKLIWTNTTPVPANAALGRREGDDQIFNAAALTVMQPNGIMVDDLNTLATRLRADPTGIYLSQNSSGAPLPNDVHYSELGYQKLAEQVSGSIRVALAPEPDSATLSMIAAGGLLARMRMRSKCWKCK
jgi:lysophospholipase L1-like esterase